MFFAAVGVVAVMNISRGEFTVAAQNDPGRPVNPANPSDELVDGPYRIDPNWLKPFATLFPEEKGWTWGAVQGIFAQNPDRIFVAMRGELPDVTKIKPAFPELQHAAAVREGELKPRMTVEHSAENKTQNCSRVGTKPVENLISQRARANLELHEFVLRASTALYVPRHIPAVGRPDPATLPTGARVVNPAIHSS
jgi:hypothetical protein